MKLWTDFFDWVLPQLPNVPQAVAAHSIKQAAIEFFEKSKVWRLWLPDYVTLAAGVNTYNYILPTDTDLIKLHQALYVGGCDIRIELPDTPIQKRQGILDLDSNSFILYPTPSVSGGQISIEATLKPHQTATGISDVWFNQYVNGIASGAIARLAGMKGKPYSDPTKASDERANFESACAQAEFAAKKGQGAGRYRTKAYTY